ncbi:MAG: hypothetical protein OHK0029_14210 [Armatimonadaceae bacterium]
MCMNYGHLTMDVVDAVEAEVARRVGNGDSFTALEISRAVQAQGIRERHRELKLVVHELFEDGEMPGYDRHTIQLPSGERPFLYHPAAVRQNTFGTARNTTPSHSGTTNPLPRALRPGDAVARWLTGDRLRLPAPLLRAAGFYPGDTVYVAQEGSKVALFALPGNAPLVHPRRPYRIGPDNSVRLPMRSNSPGGYTVTFRTPGVVEVLPQD